jgi:hypothetical protein
MLTPEQVVPFLAHEKFYVREHAASYLAGAHDPSPATADDFWRAMDVIGPAGARVLRSKLEQMPQTPESYRRTLQALAATNDPEAISELQDVLHRLDLKLLQSYRDEVLAHVKDDQREHLRKRLELAEREPTALWQELMAHGKELGEAGMGEFDQQISERLIEALGRNPGESAGSAMELLGDSDIIDWREVFAVQALGAMRCEGATDLLLGKLLPEDGDVVHEEVFRALIRIGSTGVIRKMEEFYPGKPWHVRLYLHEPFGRIKRPESEEALLRLIEMEQEKDLAGFLATSLCELCPRPEALAMLRDRLAAGRLDDDETALSEMILPAGEMVGYRPPEARRWERRAAREEERTDRMRDLWKAYEAESERKKSAADALSDGEWEDQTYRRESAKVGRNDPCPCGSGRKYKKCCLGKEKLNV